MTSPQPHKTPLPGWVKSLLFLVGAILIGGGIFSILEQAYTARWLRYADKLREGGVPLTFEEIEKQRTVIPDELNGALVIDGLEKQIEAIPTSRWDTNRFVLMFGPGPAESVDFFGGMPRYVVEPSRSFLEEHRDVLDGLERLRRMPSGRFEIDLEVTPLMMLLPNLTAVRTASKLLYLQGSIELVDGDIVGAIDTLVLQAHVGGALDQHPSVIGRLVQMAVEALGRKSIENILRVGEVDEQALLRLIDLVDQRQQAGTAKWAFLGERASWVGTCDDIADSKLTMSEISSLTSGPQGINWMPEMLIRTNQMRGAEMLTWLVDAGDDPVALRQAAARIDKEAPALPMTQMLVKIFMPSLSRAVTLHNRSVAEWSCARTALSAERFRLVNGRFPESLDQLIPDYFDELPIDPFDGQPLRLVVTTEGIIVYSVSEDGFDDGGEVTSTNKRSRAPDVGFRLLAPKHRGLLLTEDPPPAEDE